MSTETETVIADQCFQDFRANIQINNNKYISSGPVFNQIP